MRGLRRRLGFSVHRRRRTSYRWRRRRGYSSTRSRLVKLVGTVSFAFYQKGSGSTRPEQCTPFQFCPTVLSGFTDYRSTFAEFRILKATMNIPMDPSNQVDPAVVSLRRVSSRPFTTAYGLTSGGADGIGNQVVPAVRVVSELEQSRFSKHITPTDIRNSVTIKFYPYTMRWTGRPVFGPIASGSNIRTESYLEYQSARRWMPFSFLGGTNNSAAADDVSFFGPYIIPYGQDNLPAHAPDSDPNPGTVTWTRNVQLTVWCQFRGQK